MHNSETHLKNLAAFAARFLKRVWPFWNIMHQRVKAAEFKDISKENLVGFAEHKILE